MRLTWLIVVATLAVGNAAFVGHFSAIHGGEKSSLDPWNYMNWVVIKNPFAMFAHFLMGFLAADLLLSLQKTSRKEASIEPRLPLPNIFDAIALSACTLIFWVDLPGKIRGAWRFKESLYATDDFPFFHLAVVCLLVTAPFSNYVRRCLDNSFFRATAKLSFGIYLWHYPIHKFLKYISAGYSPCDTPVEATLMFTCVLILTYGVATLSYFAVERPLLLKAHSYRAVAHTTDSRILR
jgi:peptidoglycan/LPS O-acetylase OafA/YrhL